MEERTIPALPCVELEAAFDFYKLLGFAVTYRQKSPNPYGVIRRGAVELHLFGLKGLKAEEGYSTCIVVAEEVEPLHRAFGDALRRGYGKLPIAGFPRITRFKPGQGRFTVTDPSGNSVIFVKRSAHEAGGSRENLTGLAKAVETAGKLRDESGDDEAAAKVLDVALGRYEDAPAADLARALAARAELAVALGDTGRLREVRAELEKVRLPEGERERLRGELQAAEELQRHL
jgi:hypothetical protein